MCIRDLLLRRGSLIKMASPLLIRPVRDMWKSHRMLSCKTPCYRQINVWNIRIKQKIYIQKQLVKSVRLWTPVSGHRLFDGSCIKHQWKRFSWQEEADFKHSHITRCSWLRQHLSPLWTGRILPTLIYFGWFAEVLGIFLAALLFLAESSTKS